jgi:hypothetical protein
MWGLGRNGSFIHFSFAVSRWGRQRFYLERMPLSNLSDSPLDDLEKEGRSHGFHILRGLVCANIW